MRRVWLGLTFILALVLGLLAAIPGLARRTYGPPAKWLTSIQVLEYSARLLWADGLLTRPLDARAAEQDFVVQPGESADSICDRLEQQGIVSDGRVLRDYLIYTGQDTTLQAGDYRLGAAMDLLEIARKMQDATPSDVEFVLLPGWRIEEVAATLPTSGLGIDPEEFIRAAHSPRAGYDFLEGVNTLEGYLYPGSYIFARSTGVSDLLDALVRRFAQQLPGLRDQLAREDLSVQDAVILASIVQREAVVPEEAPLIASVYLNRLQAGMRLDADPTVQYALGFNAGQETWWTNPLSLEDLQVDSPYNTYRRFGLPPGPISNPGPDALRAVAEPSASDYYYFNARCDGSGYHVFSASFAEHLASLCP